MLLMLEQMLRLFDFVLAEQGPVDVVWRMLANLVPHYLGLALPLGAFLGIMLAFRNLSLSSELDALSASGASFGRMLRPVYMLMGALMVFDFLLVSYIQPFASYEYRQIRFNVTSGALGVKIPAGEFVRISDDMTIRLGSINRETREAEDIFLERRADDGSRTAISASKGAIATTPDISMLILKLENGRQVFINSTGTQIQTLDFERFDTELALPAIGVFRERGGDDREATFDEILSYLRSGDKSDAEKYHDYRAGFHWRLIHPLTFLVMPILAIAMGVTGRRRTSSLKPVVGIAVLIVYHELLEEWGKVVATEGQLSPYISMWGIFAVFAFVSIALYTGSIDQARAAKVAQRRQTQTLRIAGAQATNANYPANARNAPNKIVAGGAP